MLIETSLIAKVIILLLPQVIIFLGIPIYMVLAARKAVFSGESVFGLRFREAYNLERKLDVAIDWDDEFTWKSFANVYILLFIFLIINSVNNLLGANLLFSIPVMTFTSLLLGIWIGLLVLWLDENTGVSALITLFIILFCAILIPLFSEFNFTTGYFAMFLGICVLLLIILEICRCFRIIEFSRTGHRFTAYLGAITFSLYLLYDIDHLLRADASQNNWSAASQIAYYLYLDIVNLLLYLLEIFAEG